MRLSKIACKSGTELALRTPSNMLLCFLWTACSLPGFFQLERYAILPRSHDWQKLHWAKSAWRPLPKIAGTSTIKVKSWIRYSLHFFQNYCMFKASTTTTTAKRRERTILRTYCSNPFLPISVVYCSHAHRHTPIFRTSNDFHKIETINRQTKQHSSSSSC